jgi:Zn-finger nucleic acid-binding protein
MSESGLDKRRKALEESYFEKKNREALEALAKQIKQTEKICPVTSEALTETVLHGVVVYTCPHNKGVWVEGPQLEMLFKEIGSEEAKAAGVEWDLAFFEELAKYAKEDNPQGALKVAKELQGERISPATGNPMVQFEIDGIVLDRCEETGGIWFDTNELDELLDKAKQGRLNEGDDTPGWVRSFFKAVGYH